MEQMKILVACDSFKGSLTSAEAGASVRRALERVAPGAHVHVLCVGDGGEGTLASLSRSSAYDMVWVDTVDAVHRPCRACYGLSADGASAVVELASSVGLARLASPAPMTSSTYGAGLMVADAVRRGARHVCVTLGGSASTDGGMGLLAALGYRFYDVRRRELRPSGAALGAVARIGCDSVMPGLDRVRFTGACDVVNPAVGPGGAAAVFAPQKGATARMADELERGMVNYIGVLAAAFGRDAGSEPRAGAAGATGAALMAVLRADMISGADMTLQACGFEGMLDGASLVITGEGRADRQSLMGKITGRVLELSRRRGVPVMLLGGCVDDVDQLVGAGFAGVYAVSPPALPLRCAMIEAVADHNIYRAVCGAAGLISACASYKPKNLFIE